LSGVAGESRSRPAGELVLDYAERILGLSSELDIRVAEMTGQMSGSLLVGASTTIAEFMLPPILGEFNVRYPQVRARLTVANSEIDQQCHRRAHARYRPDRITDKSSEPAVRGLW
jgi:DNA-binding transcriptional LysR family regulator